MEAWRSADKNPWEVLVGFVRKAVCFRVKPGSAQKKKNVTFFLLEVVSCWVNSCEQKSIGVEVDQCIIRLGFYAAAHRQGFRVTQPFLIYEGS